MVWGLPSLHVSFKFIKNKITIIQNNRNTETHHGERERERRSTVTNPETKIPSTSGPNMSTRGPNTSTSGTSTSGPNTSTRGPNTSTSGTSTRGPNTKPK